MVFGLDPGKTRNDTDLGALCNIGLLAGGMFIVLLLLYEITILDHDDVSTSPQDPYFFPFHTGIDYVFNMWQQYMFNTTGQYMVGYPLTSQNPNCPCCHGLHETPGAEVAGVGLTASLLDFTTTDLDKDSYLTNYEIIEATTQPEWNAHVEIAAWRYQPFSRNSADAYYFPSEPVRDYSAVVCNSVMIHPSVSVVVIFLSWFFMLY